MTPTIEMPPVLSELFGGGRESAPLPRWALEAILVRAAKDNLVGASDIGEALGLGYFETEKFLKDNDVPVHMTAEDFRQDMEDLEKMFPDLSFK